MSVQSILLKAKKQVFAEFLGEHTSFNVGDGLNFLELREYNIGEDIRHIDWKRSAKMNKPYVKSFYQEKALRVEIVSLLSSSLHFGSKRLKQEVITEICAILGYSALKSHDFFRFIKYQNGVISSSKPIKNRIDIDKNIEEIYNANLLNLNDDFSKLDDVLFTKDKSLIFII